MTVEDPIEYTLKGIGQTQVNPNRIHIFVKGLRAMRQDPDVVMVGEMRDVETAQIGIQSSLTGHLVLSTVHTNSAVAAIARLYDIKGVLSISIKPQDYNCTKIIRRLCNNCKTVDTPDDDFKKSKLEKLLLYIKLMMKNAWDHALEELHEIECLQVDKNKRNDS